METQVARPDLLQFLAAAVADRNDLDLNDLSSRSVLQAVDKGLGPLLFATTKNNPHSTTSAMRPVLQSAELTSRILVHEQLDGLQEILAALGNTARHITLLKGISTCLKYLPHPHLRTMGDIDLFVARDKQVELEAVLVRLGYRQQSSQAPDFYKDHHHSMPFFHNEKKIWVEVHTALFPPKSRFAAEPTFSQDQIARNTQRFTFRGYETNVLNAELSIAYTACHWAETFPYPRGLMAILDVIFIFRQEGEPINWDRFVRMTEDSHTASSVYLMVSYLRRHALINIPAEVERQLHNSQSTINTITLFILHCMLDKYLVKGRRFTRIATLNNIEIVWAALLSSRSKTKNLLRVPYYLLFPPESPRRFSLALVLRRLMSAIKGGGS